MAISFKEQQKQRQKADSKFHTLYGRLNAGQKKAVDTIEGPVMVMAGPGTGKTQVLTMRIANILATTEMDPWNILCLTFTESAVAAMRERLLSIIGTPAYYVKIHTFHSFCNEIIQDNPQLFAWTRGVQVISDIERIMVLRSIVHSLSAKSPLKPFGNPYLYFNDITSNIKDLKQEDISPQDFLTTVDRLSMFAGLVADEVTTFAALSPKERTAASCEHIHEVLQAASGEAHLPASIVAMIEHLFSVYQDSIKQDDSARNTSKARTAYKNEIKKWLQKTIDSLPRQKEMGHVYAQYQEVLRKQGRYDYEDMIIKVVQELSTNDALLARYQEQFQYLLVDEYQDTNGAQNDVVDILGSFGEAPNIFVVGDDKQSIYRFQGASLANMLHFYEKYKEWITVVSLTENYRSQQTVLDAAQGVITHNSESVARYVPGVEQNLVAATNKPQEHLSTHVFSSEDAEDYFVAKKAQELIAAGIAPNEIAVLYRNNRDGNSLLQTMKRLSVPVRLEMGENILDDQAVQQWIDLLVWLGNGKDDASLSRILQYSWWHLSPVDTLKVIHYAGSRYVSLYAVLSSKKELTAAAVANSGAMLAFAEKLASFRKDAASLLLQQFLEKLVVESHWLDHIMEHDEEASALRKVTTLLQEAKRLQAAHHEFKLEQFIEHLMLLKEHNVQLLAEPWQSAKQAVRLMSAHKAKGLEFEHVFMIRLNDKHWGNVREANKAPLPHGLVKYDYVVASDSNEDERRLFYVGLTRAKQHAYMTRALHNASGKKTVPAIFLHEVPAELVDEDIQEETGSQELTRLQERLLSPIPHADHEEVRDYIASLFRGYALSATHLNNYLECPRKFYFRNLLHIPTVKTKSLGLGIAVHEALYELFSSLKETNKLLSQEEFVAVFEKALQRELLAPTDSVDALEKGKHMLTAYYERYKEEFHNDSLLEYDFSSHGVRVGDILLTGKIDKIEITNAAKKQVKVVDYKTGNVENGLKKIKSGGDYFRQLTFYQLLCSESNRFPYTMISGEFDFIEPSDKKGFIKKEISITQQDVEELKETIKQVWAEMKALTFLDKNSGCGKTDCEWCSKK